MITQVEFPSPDMLAPLREDALNGQEPAQFIQKHITSITDTLTGNPALYRSYGAYWWSIKKLLRDNGVDFGEDDELITREHVAYSDPVDLLCAAAIYQEHIIDGGGMNNNIHQFTIDDEPFDYSLEDTDMEEMIFNQSL